jgi:predicted phosphohydrolase
MYDNMFFLKNSFTEYNGIAICGTRGWICPNDTLFTDHDVKIYNREVNRMRNSLMLAKGKGFDDIMVIMHFPPTNDKLEKSDFTALFDEFGVKTVVYGHLHGEISFRNCLNGSVDGINYYLVSADYLNFMPTKISI